MKAAISIPFGLLLLLVFFLIAFKGIDNDEISKARISKPTDKNVILITISSLRADHVGCLGYHRETTPNFDAFAKSNILFTNVFAASSWQMPAIGSIFTSLYPSLHGATDIDKKLNPEVFTIAELLKENNFYTAGFCCNPRLNSESGFDQGFDLYDDYSVSIALSSLSFGRHGKLDLDKERTNDLINGAVIRWLQNNTHKPFFLFVHYYDNHWDYVPKAPFDKLYDDGYTGQIDGTEISREPLYSNKPSDNDVKHIIALYDGEVRQTDDDLGNLLKFLEKTGRFEDSIIIISGDHGEQFYEHGHTSHHGIFDELIRVPLAISVPDFNDARTINSLVSGLDILPAILTYLNIPIPACCGGKSLEPLIAGREEKVNDFVYIEYTGGAIPDAYAVRFDSFKFIQQERKIFVYDLYGDPLEQSRIYQKDFTKTMNEKYETIRQYLWPIKQIE